jgi:hypothetical protein
MMTEGSSRIALTALLVLVALAMPALSADLVVVEQPIADGSFPILHGRCVQGSTLVRIGADDSRTVLTPDFDGACDPSVSFDGRELLFAGRKASSDSWQVWKMELGTGDASRITAHPGHAFAPIWVGSVFHLDDAAPTRRIAYLATTPAGGQLPALHTSNLDGSDPLRISFSPNGDLAPEILPNGRIVYPTLGPPNGFRSSLMSLNIDGTDLAVFADPHDTPLYPHTIRVGHDGKVYYVEAVGRALQGGALATVSLRRPLRSREVVATTKAGLYLDPAPMSDGRLLASHSGGESPAWELVRLDPETGRILGIVHRREGFHVLDAHEIIPRPVVPGRSTVVDTSKATGVFFCISSHITDRPSLAHLRTGGVNRLRVLESHADRHSNAHEQILGEAPVQPDGSFHIEVPAQRPLRFQLIDNEGTVIGEQESWTWVMPREWRGCIGCHEDREMVAPNVLADAIVKPAVPVGVAPRTNGEHK